MLSHLTLVLLLAPCVPASPAVAVSRPLQARFIFTATVPAVPPSSKTLRIWVPVPSDNPLQTIGPLDVSAPGAHRVTTEPGNGNRMVYVETDTAGLPAEIRVSFDVTRGTAGERGPLRQDVRRSRYLKADARVPIGGRFAEIGEEVAGSKAGALAKMRAIYDHVVATMEYDYKKESPHLGEGDVPFVCDYKKGNCSELHSYVIALARSQGVPAYLEYGFPITGIPLASPQPASGKVGGYHCWTWFFVKGKGNAKGIFEDFVDELILGLRAFEDMQGVTAKDCVMRIYRDVRFSKDKSPYKSGMGASIGPGGRKSHRFHYYLHLEPHNASMLAGGLHEPESAQINKFRAAVARDASRFKSLVSRKTFKDYFGAVEGERLKTAPQRDSRDHPEIELLRLKEVIAIHRMSDEVVLSSGFTAHVVRACNAVKPLLDYLSGTMSARSRIPVRLMFSFHWASSRR